MKLIHAFLGLFVLFGLGENAVGQVIVKGQVYEYIGAPGGPHLYERIENDIRVLVYREGEYLPDAEELNSEGEFQLRIPWGAPFRIVLIAEGKVPELKYLAGRNSSEHYIIVALESISTFLDRGGSTALLESILADPALPEESEAAKAVEDAISELRTEICNRAHRAGCVSESKENICRRARVSGCKLARLPPNARLPLKPTGLELKVLDAP